MIYCAFSRLQNYSISQSFLPESSTMYIVAYGTAIVTNSQVPYKNHSSIAEWKARSMSLSRSDIVGHSRFRNRKELIFLVLTVS